VIKKRTDFEYRLRKRAADKTDFVRYVQYELTLDKLLSVCVSLIKNLHHSLLPFPTLQQPNNPTTQQPNNPTTQQPNNQTTKQPNNPTTQQPNNLTTQQPTTTEDMLALLSRTRHSRPFPSCPSRRRCLAKAHDSLRSESWI